MVIFLKKLILFISVIGIIIDRITKILIVNYLTIHHKIIVIKNFFHITYVKNFGAAWSILSGNKIILICIALIALFFLLASIINQEKVTKFDSVAYGLVVGGIVGNLLDRVVFGYVIDFLDFNIFGYNYPVFNIADMLIVIGALLMAISVFRSDKNENSSRK